MVIYYYVHRPDTNAKLLNLMDGHLAATGVVTSNALMATHFKRVNVTTPTFADY